MDEAEWASRQSPQAGGDLAAPNGSSCHQPAIRPSLTAYCFGEVAEADRTPIEEHLLDCDLCWQEIKQLVPAIESLRADRRLIQSISPAEVCSVFGISARIETPLAGHGFHALMASTLYALTYAFGLISETAYAFDRLGRTAIWLSILVFLWISGSCLGALAADWRATVRGRSTGLSISISVVASSAALLYGALCFFLPNVPITEMDAPAQTAQGAYLKGIVNVLPLALVHLLVPFHFVIAMQRELREGRYRLALALLSGEKRAVTPRGAVHVSLRTLWILLLGAFLLSIPLTAGLFGHVKPSPYLGLFTLFIYLRWVAYFGLGLVCLFWYYRSLNELKRECLAAQEIRF